MHSPVSLQCLTCILVMIWLAGILRRHCQLWQSSDHTSYQSEPAPAVGRVVTRRAVSILVRNGVGTNKFWAGMLREDATGDKQDPLTSQREISIN